MEGLLGMLVGASGTIIAAWIIGAIKDHMDKKAEEREEYNKLKRDVRLLEFRLEEQKEYNRLIDRRFDHVWDEFKYLQERFWQMEHHNTPVPEEQTENPDDVEESYVKEFSVSDHVAKREAAYDKRIADMRASNTYELYDIPHTIVDKKLAELPDVEETE